MVRDKTNVISVFFIGPFIGRLSMFTASTLSVKVYTVNMGWARGKMQYHHGNLKQQLIICAYGWISANGIDNLSLRKIAKIAEVSQTAPYRHFDSKEHLLADVATLGFENLSLEMSNHKTTDNPSDDLVRCGVTYIEFGLNNEHVIDLMFNYPIKKTDYPWLLAAANNAFGMLLQRSEYLYQGKIDSRPLNNS